LVRAHETMLTSAWNLTSTQDENMKLCGIEVFEVEDERTVESWSTAYARGNRV
jgi:hypothetical protein